MTQKRKAARSLTEPGKDAAKNSLSGITVNSRGQEACEHAPGYISSGAIRIRCMTDT
jgi:hypothetical protein